MSKFPKPAPNPKVIDILRSAGLGEDLSIRNEKQYTRDIL